MRSTGQASARTLFLAPTQDSSITEAIGDLGLSVSRLCLCERRFKQFSAVGISSTTPWLLDPATTRRPANCDAHAETKMKANVDSVKQPAKGSAKEVVHLLAKNETDGVDVYLCPQSFLDDMGVSFSKGDDIALTRSKVKQNGADLILILRRRRGRDPRAA
jgi:hypothetical protein